MSVWYGVGAPENFLREHCGNIQLQANSLIPRSCLFSTEWKCLHSTPSLSTVSVIGTQKDYQSNHWDSRVVRYKGDKDDGIRRIVEDDKRGDGVRTLSSVKVEKAWERIRRVVTRKEGSAELVSLARWGSKNSLLTFFASTTHGSIAQILSFVLPKIKDDNEQ